jgi:subfamily B ATP-binding cassette protein MsbA
MLIVALLEPLVPALLTPLIDENLINKSFTNAWNIPVLLMLVFIGKGIAEYVQLPSQKLRQL